MQLVTLNHFTKMYSDCEYILYIASALLSLYVYTKFTDVTLVGAK